MNYDEVNKALIEGIEKQLEFGVKIPEEFRLYAKKIIERWWMQGKQWNYGRRLRFSPPGTAQLQNYKFLRVCYSYADRASLQDRLWYPDFKHPDNYFLVHTEKQLRADEKERRRKNEPVKHSVLNLPAWVEWD